MASLTSAPGARAFSFHVARFRMGGRTAIVFMLLNPLLTLAALGAGLGSLVDDRTVASLHGVAYISFLAPGLLAATTMQAAAFESTFPIMGGLTWQKTFHAMYATPISARDIVLGNLAWIDSATVVDLHQDLVLLV